MPGQLVPDMPGPEVLLQVRAGNEYVGLDPVGQGGLHIRAVVPVTTSGNAWWNRESLQALYPVARRAERLGRPGTAGLRPLPRAHGAARPAQAHVPPHVAPGAALVAC